MRKARAEEFRGQSKSPHVTKHKYTPAAASLVKHVFAVQYNQMKLRLASKKQELGDVWSFFFDPEQPVTWQAGQSIRIELPRKTWGISERRFTIASAPCEKHIQITTKLSSSEFKQTLAKLKPNSIIEGHNIEGDFIWDKSRRPKLFLAGGVGITPLRALLAQAIHDKIPLNITLLYSTKDSPPLFNQELEMWAKKHRGFHLYITDKRIAIDPGSTLVPLWKDSVIYIAGPEKMVRQLSDELIRGGLSKSQLKTDEFTGNVL